MHVNACGSSLATLVVLVTLAVSTPFPVEAHPLGNFSTSHYAGIRIEGDSIRLRYVLDMAEIPAFQEIRENRIVPEAGHPTLPEYLARKTDALTEGLALEINGRPLLLRRESSEIIFPPGAAGLPTLKVGVVYRASFGDAVTVGVSDLHYRDTNLPGRAGWKEIVVTGGSDVKLVQSSVPARDRSRELAEYPTDLLTSPPQDLEAHVVFIREGPPTSVANAGSRLPPGSGPRVAATTEAEAPLSSLREAERPVTSVNESIRLQPNLAGTPRNAFTELIPAQGAGLEIISFAIAVAVALGAFHALEPGHGKTLVAAYLVGARGTAWHALALGLIVTVSHTAGVYLLGAVTLYASRYVLPERLYPWLGVVSGLTIAALGFVMFLRRYAATSHPHHHGHHHYAHHAGDGGTHDHDHSEDHHHGHGPEGSVSLRALLVLGVTGGIVPCPAALVVLLSAVALRRVGLGLLLIVAFSVGLAAVLIGIGLLVLYARRFMRRFRSEGPLITRWLPLTSAGVIALSGVIIATQALVTAGVLQLRL
jgi:ABC-type nickel/cobalt efflux system permease component RcnA